MVHCFLAVVCELHQVLEVLLVGDAHRALDNDLKSHLVHWVVVHDQDALNVVSIEWVSRDNNGVHLLLASLECRAHLILGLNVCLVDRVLLGVIELILLDQGIFVPRLHVLLLLLPYGWNRNHHCWIDGLIYIRVGKQH